MFDSGIMFHGAAVSHSDQHEVRPCELGKKGSNSPKASRNGNKNVSAWQKKVELKEYVCEVTLSETEILKKSISVRSNLQ